MTAETHPRTQLVGMTASSSLAFRAFSGRRGSDRCFSPPPAMLGAGSCTFFILSLVASIFISASRSATMASATLAPVRVHGWHQSPLRAMTLQLRGGESSSETGGAAAEQDSGAGTTALTEARAGGVRRVVYCKACGVPPEFCEFVGCKSPRPAQASASGDVSKEAPPQAAVSVEPEPLPSAQAPLSAAAAAAHGLDEASAALGQLSLADGEKGGSELRDKRQGDTAVNEAQIGGGGAAGTEPKGSSRGDRKSVDKAKVTIKVTRRGRRKHVTLISGLDAYLPAGETLKTTAKAMAVKFACSASVVKSDAGVADCISVQGDVANDAQELCSSRFGIRKKFFKFE